MNCFRAATLADQKVEIHQSLRSQVEAGFNRRRISSLKEQFDKHSETFDGTRLISRDNLFLALKELEIELSDDEGEETFHFANNANGLDYEEFARIVEKPRALELWASTLPLSQIVADSIPRKKGCDPLRVVSDLSQEELDVLSVVFLEGFNRAFREHAKALKEAFNIQKEKADEAIVNKAKKFEICSMSCGEIKDFHKGLSGRVGTPHLDFLRAMEAEHCTKAGATTPFTTSNYGITTTPQREWRITVKGEKFSADMTGGRKLPNIDELMNSEIAVATGLVKKAGDKCSEPDAECKGRKETAAVSGLVNKADEECKGSNQECKVRKEEVLAIVLYTGPMYMVYNMVLRQWPEDKYKELSSGRNLFSTTIHVLVSAIQKIARVMKIPSGLRLYRGLGGTLDLPECFRRSVHGMV